MKITKVERPQQFFQSQLPYCALLLIFFIFNILVNRILAEYSISIYNDWVPLLKDIFIKEPSYNKSLLSYYFYIFLIGSIFALKKIIGLKKSYSSILSNFIIKFSYVLIILNLFLLAYVEKFPFTKWICYPVLFYTLIIFVLNSGLIAVTVRLLADKLIYLILLLSALCISGYLFISSWYPVYMPNDYQTISELVPNSDNGYTPKSKIVACLNVDLNEKLNIYSADKSEFCASINQEEILESVIRDSELLNSGQDRIFYHHAYVIIPSLHIIKYGLINKFPYLYGVGNTYFSSLLIKYSGGNITGYFNSYPIAQIIGILFITVLVGYITKSIEAAVFSGLLVFFFLSKLGFENILLAPGFNPIRYLGICLQIAALKYFSELSNKKGGLLLLISSIVSGLWNFEYFSFGVLAQATYLLLSIKNNNIFKRIRLIAVLLGIFLLMALFTKYITGEYIQTMQLAVLGLFTYLSTKDLLILIFVINLILLLLVKHSKKYFQDNELYFRLSILFLGLLLFSKYIFYPHRLHLIASMIMIAPLTLIFIDWKRVNLLIKFSLLVFSLYIVLTIFNYKIDGTKFINSNVKAFNVNYWNNLNEKFFSSMPEDEIFRRVKLIKEEDGKFDRLLILSPYDHLISAFVNPKEYCGHFELNLNLLTNDFINKVIECVKKHPDTLIIYDDMLRFNCEISKFKNDTTCKFYNITKSGPLSVYESLSPNLVLEKKEGPLTFYRYKP